MTTSRDLWLEIMNYGTFDRMYVSHWGGWHETCERWRAEGMPVDVDQCKYFGAEPMWIGVGLDWEGVGAGSGLYPTFPETIMEETSDFVIRRGRDGVIEKSWKGKTSIPHHMGYTFQTADDWPEFKKRLQPDDGRLVDIAEQVKKAEASDFPVFLGTGSMMGWLRNWMGVENLSFLMYDDPDCFGEVVDTISTLACWSIDKAMAHFKGKPVAGMGWEDICGKSGPLVSPHLFIKHVAPGYQKIRNKLESHGIHFLGIDTDGYSEPLVQHWLDAGVNIQFPVEFGTWGATPADFRKKFGRELRMIGGFNKLVMEDGPAAIDAELGKHYETAKAGGLILCPDHLITPGVSLESYKYFLKKMKELRF
jgi:uroporphyrinogen-III decarboxylase